VLSSWLPKELLPRIEINAAVQSLPSLVQHGTEDPTIQVDRARSSVENTASIEGAANLS
jgi:hypothetical protein